MRQLFAFDAKYEQNGGEITHRTVQQQNRRTALHLRRGSRTERRCGGSVYFTQTEFYGIM
ncbi:MAG TPA: hypothetical protein DDX51_04665 [Clostridiales bacterium]|nr:hypothetical protein [Clostridiales bacterium]